MGKSSLLIWCGNLILQKDLHHVYLILRNLLYLIPFHEISYIYEFFSRMLKTAQISTNTDFERFNPFVAKILYPSNPY